VVRRLAPFALAALNALGCAGGLVRADDPRIAIMGRVDRSEPARMRIGYPGVTLRVRFEGPSLSARFSCSNAASRVSVTVDGAPSKVVRLASGESDVVLADGLGSGPHQVVIVHRTETWQGILGIRGFLAGKGGKVVAAEPWPERRLLFIGDSVTCGEGIDRAPDCSDTHDAAATSNGELSYAMLLARALGAQAHLVCFGGRGLVRDWRGNSRVLDGPRLFEAALPLDVRPPPWDHARYAPDVVVVSLGTNDFNLDLGPFPEREAFVTAYVAFVRTIRSRHPNAHVLLTEGAIVNDEKDPARPQKTVLAEYIAEAVRRVADPRVRAVPSRHYPGDACNPHPTRAQHESMARDLEPFLRLTLPYK
jgi:lysophospholipase L1-like esterase